MTHKMNGFITITQDERAILDLMNEVLFAFNQGDLEKLLSFHTEDIILMEPNMPIIRGKNEIRQLFASFSMKKITMNLQFEICELEVFHERAFVRGRLMKTVYGSENITEEGTGKFICLLKKQAGGNWLRTHVIVNNDEPVPATEVGQRA